MKTSIKTAVIVFSAFGILCFYCGAASYAQSPPPEIHCKHFVYGYPLGVPATNDLIIRDCYALSSNDTTKFADWVCYKLTPHETEGILDLERDWHDDPWLHHSERLEGESKATDDYRGAWSQLKYDRGHMAPLASFKGSRYASQVNYYSNITPQKSDLNQGPWKELENKIRGLVKKYLEVWVMTGPLYESQMPSLPKCDEPHTVPSGFWKIVVVKDSGTTRVAGFIMRQDTERDSEIKSHLVKVREIETRTGLDFLWELSEGKQNDLEEKIWNTWVDSWIN